MDIVIAGGVESMSRVPLGATRQNSDWSEELTYRYEMIHLNTAIFIKISPLFYF
jgi:acetyl-CoA acyltransferase